MATLITKNSSTAAAVPGTGDLVQGELAVNVTDKKVYTKDSGGAVVKLVGSLGNQESNAPIFTGPLTTNGSTGTSGQVLTSQGSGSPAQWVSPDPGLKLLATVTPTGGSTSATVTGLPAVESIFIITGNGSLSNFGSGIYFGTSDNNGSSYAGGVLFTDTSSSIAYGQAQLYRTKTAGIGKPCMIIRGNGTVQMQGPTTSGIVNAIKFETNGVATFNAGSTIYVYGLG